MSGIAGVLHFDGRPASDRLVADMLGRLAHRGPHANGVWTSGNAGLGHCLLRTTPEAEFEAQPIVDEESGVALVADARIDNREDLAPLLGLELPAGPDSDFILRAYLKWGASCPEYLLGDYAFTVWDPRSRTLLLARDAFGIRPLVYCRVGSALFFASEIAALQTVPEVPRRLDEGYIAALLVPRYDDVESTPFEGIRRVRPAHTIAVDSRGLNSQRYYHVDSTRELTLGSDADYEEAFRSVFGDAVRSRLRSSGEIGTTLSGGLDSSAITCVARRMLSPAARLHTFSGVFPRAVEIAPHVDERSYIDSVLQSGDFVAHYANADQPGPLSNLLRNQGDEPAVAPNLYLSEALFAEAGRAGVRVLLSGFDGDVTVSYGYERLEQLAASAAWPKFLEEARAVAARDSSISVARLFALFGLPSFAQLASRGQYAGLLRSVSSLVPDFGYPKRRVLRRVVLPAMRARLSRRGNIKDPVDPKMNLALLPNRARAAAGRRGATWGSDIEHPFLGYLLGQFDAMTTRHGVEQRYPFFDRRLVEFCVSVPLEQRLKHGYTRSLFRRAMHHIVPDSNRLRVDKGTIGIVARMNVSDALPSIREKIEGSEGTAAFIDRRLLEEVMLRFERAPRSASEYDLFTIFLSAALAYWLDGRNLTNE